MAKKKVDFVELLGQVHNYDVNLATREIYLHSHYGASGPDEESGVEFRMATTFVKNLHVLDQAGHESILIHLQSPGGDWGHGMAIYDAIHSSQSPIAILAHGEVSSMSGIIFQASQRRVMMPSCEMMIHRGFLSLDGVSSTVQANALWNKKTDLMMLQIYAARAIMGKYFKQANMTHQQVLRYIDRKIQKLGDWNLDAEQAVYYGFADGIFGDPGFETLDKIRRF
jgi:ATP-dependent protease ClpP protease subunit